ncbi:MAG: hypothetical protein ACT4PE_13435, partial [Candidatus Eiseniibacteriota bacterium]
MLAACRLRAGLVAPFAAALIRATNAGAAEDDPLRIAQELARRGDFRGAREMAEAAAHAARDAGDSEREGWALETVGDAAFYLDETDRALGAYEAMLACMTRAGTDRGRAFALKDIGVIHRTRGDLERALAFLHDAERVFDTLALPAPDASILQNLGSLYERLGADGLAAQRYERAVSAAELSGAPDLIINTRGRLAARQRRTGSPAEAITTLVPALALSDRYPDLRLERLFLEETWAVALERAGRRAEAMTSHRRGLLVSRELGHAGLVAFHLERLARLGGERDPAAK